MFRQKWDEFEKELTGIVGELKDEMLARFQSKKGNVVDFIPKGSEDFEARSKAFKKWGNDYVGALKQKVDSKKIIDAKANFLVLLRNLGINDELLVDSFNQNKKEFLDPLVGETIAIVSMLLGWSKKDKEVFSQALGEIGVAGVFAAKPFICLLAICGLAYGYHKNFHKESFKKGGVIGLAGVTVAALSPGGFIGLLAAVVTMVYFNKKISVDKPVESQVKEIFNQVKSGVFFKEVRQSWKAFESFLSELIKSSGRDESVGPTGVIPDHP